MTDPAPAAPLPDDKDWTWTLIRPCPECGFNASDSEPAEFASLIEELAERFRHRLDSPDAHVRPGPTTWSPIEYGQHLADVCEVMRLRLNAIRQADGEVAGFGEWSGDAAALEKGYWRADSHATSVLLRERAETAASAFAELEDNQWGWPGRRTDGVDFTAETLGRYLLHELAHHVHDVGA